ncbi:MAG: hypothetical protein R2939_00570 [Kofleriaceae bacterium]
MQACLLAEGDAQLAGKILVRVMIGLDGRPTVVVPVGMSTTMGSCVGRIVRGVRFPQPVGGPVEIVVPLQFEMVRATRKEALPAQPSLDDLTSGMEAIRTQVVACGRGLGKTISLWVRIAPDGKVVDASVQGAVEPDAAACMVRVARTATFAPSQRGTATSYPFTLDLP